MHSAGAMRAIPGRELFSWPAEAQTEDISIENKPPEVQGFGTCLNTAKMVPEFVVEVGASNSNNSGLL